MSVHPDDVLEPFWAEGELRQAIYDAIRASDAGPVPVNFARDHHYPAGTEGYVTDNDWYAWRAEAVLRAIKDISQGGSVE